MSNKKIKQQQLSDIFTPEKIQENILAMADSDLCNEHLKLYLLGYLKAMYEVGLLPIGPYMYLMNQVDTIVKNRKKGEPENE